MPEFESAFVPVLGRPEPPSPTEVAVRVLATQPPELPSAPPQRRNLELSTEPSTEGLDVSIRGELRPDWSLYFARGLALRGVSLLEGAAQLREAKTWEATVKLDADPGRLGAAELLNLLRDERPLGVAPEPKLLDYQVSLPGPGLSRVSIEVNAWESVGLFAGVLSVAEGCGFTPTAFALETEQECAFHELELVPRGGGLAGHRAVLDLERRLRRCVGG